MSDVSRQQKLASAKKKLKKFQKGKSPTTNGVLQENHDLSKEIIRGIQNNHIFKTPPLTVSKSPQHNVNSLPIKTLAVNQKLTFSTPRTNSSLIGMPNQITTPVQSMLNGSIDKNKSLDNSTSLIHELEQSLASYKRSNQQLGNQVNEQRRTILQLQEKVKKDVTSSQQLIEQRALKEQLEVHIQTIGILVSEKSELQGSIANIQKKILSKEEDILELNNRLQTAHQHVVELEKTISQLQATTGQLNQTNKDVVHKRDRLGSQLYEVNQEKDELQLQNSELHAKLQVKVEECALLLNQVNKLHTQLQKGELMVQQLSTSSVDVASVAKWHEEKSDLMRMVEEQKNIVHRLVADKAELLEKNNDTQGHYDIQVEQLKNKVNTLEGENHALLEKTKQLSEACDNLQNQLVLKTQNIPEIDTAHLSSDKNYERLNNEKLSLEKELDIQITENRRLGRIIFEQNSIIEELNSSLAQSNAEKSDKSSLLDQIQADKETISRALQQNKTLKEQLAELEEGFVKMSNNSADLTSKLESERHGNKDVASKLSDLQLQFVETKNELELKSKLCETLQEELIKFKEEVHNVQKKMASREMDVDLLTTELEMMKYKVALQQEQSTSLTNTPDLSEKLQEELHSAQNTINQLSFQNAELRETIEELRCDNNLDGSLYPGGEIAEQHFSQSPPEYNNGTLEEGVEERDDEEMHARSWDELEDDAIEDSGYTDNAIQLTHDEISNMQVSLHELQSERLKIVGLLQQERERYANAELRIDEHVELKVQQQLLQRERELQEHFYEQTEALQSKVLSLQEALEIMRKNEDIADFDMTSDGITMPLLKTAFMQLQKRYKAAMDAKAQLSDRIEQIEHMNMKLETETETIGEYIALYQTQRQALKAKFGEKDQIIVQLSNEHSRMQVKVTQLHQLVMQMLSERSGIESKNKQLQELVNRRLALQTGDSIDTEVPQLQYNLDNLFGQMTLTPEEENELVKDNIPVDDNITRDSISDQTMQQILQIFEQIETTGEGYQHGWLSPAARKHNFQSCRYCTGPMLHL